ncbi:MAG: hypothetical protein SFV22_09845 [Saprospiraceae bacterium]|nr:hypothetical protein [Saprospiraceae bacterium]
MPFIPLIIGIAKLAGAGTLMWYYSKPKNERAQLDAKAENYAWDLLKKKLGG